jgi:hypothetical protein
MRTDGFKGISRRVSRYTWLIEVLIPVFAEETRQEEEGREREGREPSCLNAEPSLGWEPGFVHTPTIEGVDYHQICFLVIPKLRDKHFANAVT